MTYAKSYTAWQDFPDTTTPITAAKLQNIDDGIAAIGSTVDSLVFNVKDAPYGAVGNGTTDDTAHIQAAIDAARAVSGGTVYFPLGVYVVNGTLDLTDYENIHLAGAANPNAYFTAAPSTGTVFKRVSGSGTMLKWEALNATQSLRGNAITDIFFNGAGLAGTVVSLKSMYGGNFRNLMIRNGTTAGLALSTVDLPSVEDLQFCRFENIQIRESETSGKGITLDSWQGRASTGAGNVSLNTFINVITYTNTGTGFEIGDADDNVFIACVAHCSGAAIGFDLLGSNTAFSGHCRHNVFFLGLNDGGSSFISRGTDAGYLTPAASNYLVQSRADSAAVPTVGTGSTLWVQDTTGNLTASSITATSANVTGIVTAGTAVAIGTSPASAGTVRLPNNQYISAKSSTGGDVNAIRVNTSDEVEISASRFTSSLAVGTSTADSGAIRLANNAAINGRRAANDGNVGLILANASNEVQIGTGNVIRLPVLTRVTDAANFEVGSLTGSQIASASSQKLGFWGKTPVTRPTAYTPTNVTTDRAYDANATTIDELADVLGTLIADLQSIGLIG